MKLALGNLVFKLYAAGVNGRRNRGRRRGKGREGRRQVREEKEGNGAEGEDGKMKQGSPMENEANKRRSVS